MTTRITNSYSSAVYNSSRTTKQAAAKASKATASSSKKSSSNVIRTNSSNATSVSSKSTAKKTNAASSTKSTVNKNKKTNITTSSSNASGKNVKKTNSALSKATSTTKSGGTRTTVNTARVSSISRSKPNSSVTSKMTRSEKAEQIRISYAVAALAARNAGIKTDIYGRPLINNGDESRRYAEQYNKLKGSEGRIMAAKAAGIDVYANGEPKITSKHDYEAYQKAKSIYSAYQKKLFSPNAYNNIKNKYENGSSWDGEHQYTSKNNWTSKGCVAFASMLFQEIWSMPLDVAFDINNKSGDDGSWNGRTSIYGLNTGDNVRYAKKDLTLKNAKDFFSQLEIGTCIATDYAINHTLVITEINVQNSILTVYEGNVNSGCISYRECSFEEFINHYDDNNDNIVKIYTCVSGNRRLDNNGNIVENNYPELYGY